MNLVQKFLDHSYQETKLKQLTCIAKSVLPKSGSSQENTSAGGVQVHA